MLGGDYADSSIAYVHIERAKQEDNYTHKTPSKLPVYRFSGICPWSSMTTKLLKHSIVSLQKSKGVALL